MNRTNPVEQTPLLVNTDGSPYIIPLEGSLGLLALGYVGLMAWREKRMELALVERQVVSESNDERG